MPAIYVLNGPNLNLLGTREPDVYGSTTLAQIEQRLRETCGRRGYDLKFRQSNHEGDLIDWIHEAGAAGAPVVLNAGALTHTSIALPDAIKGAKATVVEVHLSNTHAREEFRRHSWLSPVCKGVILGFGPRSYDLAVDALLQD